MNIKDLTYVALKITGLFCLLMGLEILSRTLSSAAFLSRDVPFALSYLLAQIVPFVSVMLLAYLLITKTEQATRILTLHEYKGGDGRTHDVGMHIEELLHIAFAIIGIAFLISGLSDSLSIPTLIQSYLNQINADTGLRYPFYFSSFIHQAIEITFKIVVGLYMFFGGRGLVEFWSKNQFGGEALSKYWQKFRESRKLID